MRKPKEIFMQRKRVSEETSKEEAVFWTLWRHKESCRNDMALSNESNKFDNNDPCIKTSVQVKPSVIDLEGYGASYADKGQAGNVQAERLNLMGQFWRAIVRSTQRKVLKLTEMISSFPREVTTWLRHTAGCSFYQGEQARALNKLEIIDLELAA